jgi:hypothetical protein
MFIGHYGVSLAAKRFAPRAPLGVLFLAVQLLDLVFMLLLLAGVEKMRIVPGFTKTNSYELTFLPYSHSFAGAILWAAIGALLFGAVLGRSMDPKAKVAAALAVGICVFSHFVLDYPMHTPDLPLGFDGATKVGLGLWNQVDVTIALEVGLLVAGGALYIGATRALPGGGASLRIAAVVLVALAVATPFLPPPPSESAFAVESLVGYVALAALAEWVDRRRAPVANPVI